MNSSVISSISALPTVPSHLQRGATLSPSPSFNSALPFFHRKFAYLVSLSSISPRPLTQIAAAPQPPNPKKEDKLVTEGLITELLPNCMFRVRLDNGEVILGYVSGKMRTKMVRVLVGDKVRIEVSRYDSTRGRIIYRLRSKSSTD